VQTIHTLACSQTSTIHQPGNPNW